jgi:hypothetical protein
MTTATGRVKGHSIHFTKPLPQKLNGRVVTVVINSDKPKKKREIPAFDLGIIPGKISRDEIYSR